MIRYLLVPRPGPFCGAGKIAFFLAGSVIALSAGIAARGAGAWLITLLLYEGVVSQGKYFLNDYAGRASDSSFLRGARNRYPGGKAGAAVAAFAVLRCLGGVVGLWLLLGAAGIFCGCLTLALQAAYEAIKCLRMPRRGVGLFLVVAANYGVRSLAGLAAIEPSSAFTRLGAVDFIWAASIGSLFLSTYWQRQGAYYLRQGPASVALVARHKPGVFWMHTLRGRETGGTMRSLPTRIALLSLSMSALAIVATGPRLSLAVPPAVVLATFTAVACCVLTSEATRPVLVGISREEERDAA